MPNIERLVSGECISLSILFHAQFYYCIDVLLCHDDELEGRRIAYILYLVDEDWSESDGGSLDLFSIDNRGRPDHIIEKILPAWNSFAFFEVTPISFHQVNCAKQIFGYKIMYDHYCVSGF